MMTKLILASGSTIRAKLLRQAGYVFDLHPSDLDEDSVKAKHLGSSSPEEIAVILAEAKALSVSRLYPDALVIGADQVLDFHGELLSKISGLDAAAEQLGRLVGDRHELISALALAQNGKVKQTLSERAALTLRPLNHDQIRHYLDQAGEDILHSVGCYQIEEFGIQLFERIDGDLFTVMGLPLIALRSALTRMGFDPLSAQPTMMEGRKP